MNSFLKLILKLSLIIISSILASNPQNRRIGSVNDIDPANGVYGSIDQNNYQQQQQQNQTRQSQQYGGHHQQQPSHKSKLVSLTCLSVHVTSFI